MTALRVAPPPLERLAAWYFEPAPAERLATMRVLVGAFAGIYLAIRLPQFLAVADFDAARFAPTGPLFWLGSPLPDGLERALPVAAMLLAVPFTLGIGFRLTGPMFAAALLATTAYRSSWGQLLHFENLFVLHVMVLAASPAADALAVRRKANPHKPSAAERYGWPLRLMGLITVSTYVLAATTKLQLAGVEWVSGDTLENHVAYANARLAMLGEDPAPLGEVFLSAGGWLPLLAGISLLVELTAPLALFARFRTGWVAAAWAMHAGILATMLIVFPYPLAGIAFLPFYRCEHLAQRVHTTRRRLSAVFV